MLNLIPTPQFAEINETKTLNVQSIVINAADINRDVIDDFYAFLSKINIQNSNGNVLKRRQSAYETKVKDNTIAELVKAENAAVHQLSKDIAQTLSKM